MISAAHCFSKHLVPQYIEAIVGTIELSAATEGYGAKYDIEQIIQHPFYSKSTTEYDIALLKTTRDIEWSRGVGPICLPPMSKINDRFTFDIVDVIGWGSIFPDGPHSDLLQKIQLSTMENDKCQSDYDGVLKIYDSQMCTIDLMHKKRDSCSYDAGGPVILRESRMFLLGVISLGYGCPTIRVNTRITSHLRWILQNSQQTTCRVEMQ